MSGGHFEYDQYKIGYIADEIQRQIDRNGQEKTAEEIKESYLPHNWFEEYPEDKIWHKYSDEVIIQFKIAVTMLRMAEVYAHRIDWLLSGDDGEESFLRRLEEQLKNKQKPLNDN